jgi:hypothetical protein
MAGTIVYKKGHTTRIPGVAYVAGAPLDLAAIDVQVRLSANDVNVDLTEGAGVTVAGATGAFSYDVSAANLTTLGNPDTVTTVLNFWNADNTLALTATAVVGVEL